MAGKSIYDVDWTVVDRFRAGPVHTTDLTSYSSIVEEGEIRPNDGSFRHSWPQSRNSICRQENAISLFDLTNASEASIRQQWREFAKFLTNWQPTVCLQFRLARLEPALFRGDFGKEDHFQNTRFIRHLEACYRGKLSTADTLSVFVVAFWAGWQIGEFLGLPSEEAILGFVQEFDVFEDEKYKIVKKRALPADRL